MEEKGYPVVSNLPEEKATLFDEKASLHLDLYLGEAHLMSPGTWKPFQGRELFCGRSKVNVPLEQETKLIEALCSASIVNKLSIVKELEPKWKFLDAVVALEEKLKLKQKTGSDTGGLNYGKKMPIAAPKTVQERPGWKLGTYEADKCLSCSKRPSEGKFIWQKDQGKCLVYCGSNRDCWPEEYVKTFEAVKSYRKHFGLDKI